MFESLVIWYKKEARKLPWRETTNPYKIWLSEVILQQTRVEQGLKYYHKFVSSYPTIFDLANAPLDDILLLWQGLGYYSRARNLHIAAGVIVKKYNGIFPDKINELKKIKGIGDYTAAAIASFAYLIPIPVVDGNVFRVLSRYFEISEPIDTAKGKKQISELAAMVMNINKPDIHNQAIMELGALVCKPKQPVCGTCPLSGSCGAYKNNTFLNYPVKKKKIVQHHRHFYFVLIESGNEIIIEKRLGKDIWQDLYQFPLVELNKPFSDNKLINHLNGLPFFNGVNNIKVLKLSAIKKHVLSHQVIFARFIHIKIDSNHTIRSSSRIAINKKSLHKYAFPRLITRYLEEECQF
jgi:A/G-specific adenine glycosylase